MGNKSSSVLLLPAHPANGSMSMFRYWQLLAGQIRGEDSYAPRSFFFDVDESLLQRGSKMRRAWTRGIHYPCSILRQPKCDLYHVLDHSWADLLRWIPSGAKTVVTVHDLIPLRFAGELKQKQVERFRKRVSYLRKADALIAVSEHTKNEIIDILSIAPEKIHVVPNGVKPAKYDVTCKPLGGEEVLRVGSLGSVLKRKNLEILPAAIEQYLEKGGRKMELVRAGAYVSKQLAEEFQSILGSNFIELGRVSSSELEEFYKDIDVLVVPSLYEGFGLPLLEAMARGVPVIASNTTSLPEVGGDAVMYVNPHGANDIAQALLKIQDSDVHLRMMRNGLKRSQNYSWRATLEGNYAVYDKVLGRS
ncbi:glycosyltransferase family 4 protein [Rubritalea spongiae]|uniref:Glycosyltransferase family 4 protein n=2 Tax=Rubritalea spongiae TaxID=430797 RepID=A0ABW5E6X4_9BACT